MNMNGIYTANFTSSAKLENVLPEGGNANILQGYEKGQVIEGIISKVSDKVSIDFSGRELTFAKETVQNAKEGEIRKFKIMDVSVKSIVLKEVGNTVTGNSNGILCTTVEIDRMVISENLKSKENGEASEEKIDAQDISNRLTESDYKNLSEELLPMEEYNLERLDRAITRIKNQKELRQESNESQIRQRKEQSENAKKMARAMILDSSLAEAIALRLTEADLPVTEDNVKRIAATMQMTKSIGKTGDNAKAYLIRNELEPTINNIYKSVHSGRGKEVQVSDEIWEQIKYPAGDIITAAGYEINEKTLADAKWLLAKDLPLTTENLKYKQMLDDMSSDGIAGDLLKQMISSIKEGTMPEETNLLTESKKTIQELIDEFAVVSDEAILKAEENNNTINLKVLKEANAKINKGKQLKEISVIQTDVLDPPEWSISAITAKRQLEEIRLKLTIEAGQKLVGKGIQIETDSLEKVVEGLRELEDSYYKSLMKESFVSETEGSLNLLKQANESLLQLKTAPVYVLADTFKGRQSITVGTLVSEANTLKANMERAGEAYETVMTVPRKDLGDSIQKAFRNVDTILEDMNLELTKANQRAVRILGYNSMELSYENIAEMKLYDAKVNDMLRSMQPAVTTEMIKRGLNPLHMTVHEVTNQADAIKEELGVTKEEKYSNYLLKLEKQDAITEEERKSYIGIYRLLNQVNKTDGAAIGALVKSGQELTLSNLLTAVRTMKSGGVHADINDEFGVLSKLYATGDSITDQIYAGMQANAKSINAAATAELAPAKEETLISYGELLVQNVMDMISPDKLSEIFRDADGVTGSMSNDTVVPGYMTLEQFSEAIAAAETSSEVETEYYKEKAEDIRKILEDSKEAVEFLRRFEIEDSISMISASKQLLEIGDIFGQMEKILNSGKNLKASQQILNHLGSREELQAEYAEFAADMEEELADAMDTSNISAEEIKTLLSMNDSIRLTASLAEREYYEIPVFTKQGVTGMNVMVVRDGKGSGKLNIKIPGEHGNIHANISVKDGELQCFMGAESAAGLSFVRDKNGELEKGFSSLGLSVKQLNFGMERAVQNNFIYRNGTIFKDNSPDSDEVAGMEDSIKQNTKTDTNMLYRVAKMVVEQLI